jgi:flagellar hook-associated protein 3 FlgL
VQLSIERYTAAEVPVLGADDVDAAGRLTEAGLQKLADAINASTPADPGPLQRGLAEIDALGLGLVSALATIGGEQTAVERQQGLLEDDRLRTTVLLSDIRDLDYNEAVTRLKQELLSLEAFQRSFAQTTQLGLFDFLN